MNAQAHMPGQISGRVSNQPNPQLSGLSQQNGNALHTQMHNLGMDRELIMSRHNTRTKILQFLQRRSNNTPYAEWIQRIPELARQLEEILYKDSASKQEDYKNMATATVEQRLLTLIKNMPNNNHPLSHPISSSPSVSTMIPTPGMTHGGSTNSVLSRSMDDAIMSTNGAGMMAQSTVNTGNLLPTANGSTSVGHNASFGASDGLIRNRYQNSAGNYTLGSGGNNVMASIGTSRQLSQMIPTPGLSNPPPISVNSECSNGDVFSGIDSTMVSQQQHQHHHHQQQQQKQYVGNQNSHLSHSIGGQMGAGSRPNIQHKLSPYVFSNGVMNGGFIGNNMHLVNGPAASDSFLSTAYGSSPKPLKQQFDQQHNQPGLPASLSQQMLPMVGDEYSMNSADLPASENMYSSSSIVPSMNNQNMNHISLHSKSRTTHASVNHNARLQSIPQSSDMKPQAYDHSNKVNFQLPQSTPDHLMQVQHHFQNFQQQPNQTYGLVQQRQPSMDSNFGGQLMLEHGSESHSDLLFPQAGNISNGAQLLGHLPGPEDFQQQMLHFQQQVSESQNDYNALFVGSQADALQQGRSHSQPLQGQQILDKSSFEQNIQQEFHQRLTGQEEAQQPRYHATDTQNVSAPQPSSRVARGLGDYRKQQRWLLFLLHACKCSAPKGACKEAHCVKVQQLVVHMRKCNQNHCDFSRCCDSKKLVQHHDKCREVDCPVCIPVRDFLASSRKVRSRENQINNSWRIINTVGGDGIPLENSVDQQSSKRAKLQHYPSLVTRSEASPVSVPVAGRHVFRETLPSQVDTIMSTRTEAYEVKIDSSVELGQGSVPIFGNTMHENLNTSRLDVKPFVQNDVAGHVTTHVKQEPVPIEKDSDQVDMEVEPEANHPTCDSVSGSKSGKPKIKGVSLTELFTPEQIREHIASLRQWVGQSRAKAEKNQAMEQLMSENSCQLCAVEKLTFEPPPTYCTPCGARIKRNAAYYTMGSGDTRHYFCVPCYNEARGDTIDVEGSPFPKARLEKKKNDEHTEESWVQCDKCEGWQHQICALFNGRRNDGGQAEYTCPNCCMEGIEKGERKPLPQSAVLGAKDLPRTTLSDHIEKRLLRRLKQERQERARNQGKSIDEVPGAEALVVRVVSSVDKKLDVKQRFLEIFQEENYPTEFPYKSKVVLLFQKIEGVEVCLFGMYVQEFGSECQSPNQRRVYLSYLDSVKYFRPEIRTVTGEALRTFVYHEILIGYLEYCKLRGFTSCYIWACPPLKGEDYILYCHPEIQKTPKSDKLREWYLSMLRKASKENIVVDLTNLYDLFFTTLGECKAKVTAARLPYFDGDYWPGAAEDMINQLYQEEDGRQKKGKIKKTLTKRALKAAGQTDLSSNASKDAILMQKLGETIRPMKEDFIMVHLQHACTHCCLLMTSGTRWVCNQCKNFQLCDKCHDAEQRLEERDKHPVNSKEKHMLYPTEIKDVSPKTEDMDEILESEFFDTRQAFLSLCQGNHYQYDTLRSAKHSSMMVLYHLHNPTAPAFVTTCNVCHHDIETGQGWRCEVCPDFDICNACYQKDGGVDHPHKLTNHPSIAERDAQNQEARQKRVLQLRKMLDLLVHASKCRISHCQYPNCRKVKGLFRHGIQCKIRASGGCPLCKKMWYLLQLHARACKESNCHVPRCKDLKEHLKRLQQQSDSRRRAAVMEMMRQRAAEVAGGNE